MLPFASFAGLLCALCGKKGLTLPDRSKSLTAKDAKKIRKERKVAHRRLPGNIDRGRAIC